MATIEKLEKLAGLGSVSLAPKSDLSEAQQWLPLSARHKDPLLYLLSLRNGFYAFESALHVFPFSMLDCCNRQDLLRWNAPDLWKYAYGLDGDDLFCFAEDVFGYQFCVHEDRIGHFDPETGEVSDLCGSLEEWATLMCSDFEVHTGYRVAHDWQASRGPLKIGNRLVPIYPFVTSEGTYELSNLYEVNALAGMRSRAEFARQIKAIPDGGHIRIVPSNVRRRDGS